MKKKLSLLLALVLVVSLAACSNTTVVEEEPTPTPEATEALAVVNNDDGTMTLTGTAQGFGGLLTVEVKADANKLYDITVTDYSTETEGIGQVAAVELPPKMVAAQSIAIDGMSGATYTSDGIKEAIKAALTSGGIDPATFETAAASGTVKADDVTLEADVVVIGAGGAGMTAAIVAADAGQTVVLLESTGMVGGNSVRSTGGMNAAKTEWQNANDFGESAGVEKTLAAVANYPDNARIQELGKTVAQQWAEYQANPTGYFDSVELFELDTLIGGAGKNDPELVETLVGGSEDSIEWLATLDPQGILHNVAQFGGAAVKRIHRPVNDEGKVVSVGAYIVPVLQKNVEARGIQLLFNTPAEKILVDSTGAAVGVVATGETGNTVTVNAKAVVIATGGFGANLEMVASYKPELEGFMTTNAPGIQGQGILMAQEVGADTVDMDQIQIHPTVEANTAALITEGLRGDGAILVNQEGERFYDEVSTRDKVSAAEIAQTGSYSWLIVDQKMVDASSVIQGYITKGYTLSGNTYEELAQAIGAPVETFAATMETWNGYVAAKSDPDFGRTSFANPLDTAPYYAIKVTAGIHHTMGGVKIDSETRVIGTDGNVIPGLFAAGEVTGGVHGANRLGGNAVADFVVFGRIAGASAAVYASQAVDKAA